MPVTTNTLFNCASMSKAFTAAAISLLVDDNDKYPDIQWNAPVSSLIRDDFVLSNPRYTEEVTVEDILSHRSGLPE
jgi:CubicO group peptidase (beta-lactamase class C family)